MMNKRAAALLALLLLCLALPAMAQEAQPVTEQCRITANGKTAKARAMLDQDYTTYYTLKKGGWLDVECDAPLSGVFLQFYDRATSCDIQVEQNGQWVTVDQGGEHLSDWFPLPEDTRRFRIVNTAKARMFLAEITLYGEGEKPPSAPRWIDLDKADLMLVAAHPDDELLWFGGLLPTYAGERGLRVQVVYLVPSTPQRRLELLDGLAHCGVTAYPAFAGMRDARANTLKGQYKHWNKNSLLGKMVGFLRQYRPEVLVTQDFNGEYGHGAHRVAADICSLAVKAAAKEAKYPKSVKEYGIWQVKKLYVHLYKNNQIALDWHQPLEAFGGKTGMTVAAEALQCHASQVKHGWAMEEGGPNDNSLFGLYFTCVGEDIGGGDLMENIHLDGGADDGRAAAGQ